MKYIELQSASSFSFLRGGSQPEELVNQASELNYRALAITDRNTLSGVPRGFFSLENQQLQFIVGSRLDLQDGPSLLAYPTDIKAYSHLSNLLTVGNLRTEKGECLLYRKDVYEHAKGIKFIVVPPVSLTLKNRFEFEPGFKDRVGEYKEVFGKNLYIAGSHYYQGIDAKRLHGITELAKLFQTPMVATNDVRYHSPNRRQLQDVLTCTREKKIITNAGFLLDPNAERYLKSAGEMFRLFKDYPDALYRTEEIAEACRFKLNELKYEYPSEVTGGRPANELLAEYTWEGARERFGDIIPSKVHATILKELAFIQDVNYAPYFLTVHDVVRFCRSQNILCQGRGSAANSAVCYCLGITSVDPSKFDLLFERFISSDRGSPPDIDIDVEHERLREVQAYFFAKYGADRAAMLSTIIQQRSKGAIRDAGKAMGMSVDTVGKLSSTLWEFTSEWFEEERIQEAGLDPNDKNIKKSVQLAGQMLGFPRQLGRHPCGFVITNGKLADLCPVMNSRTEEITNIEWNKDDADLLGFMKVDVLALGMLTCIRKSFDLIQEHYGRKCTLANLPQDDPAVYDMICKADTIGVFQIESRAQQSMLPRLKPRKFYDLVIQVAIVRPGPIQGKMVHPYLRRRNGEEAVTYPSEELKGVLEKTLGVPLFQEQVMQIAIVAAGFTGAEADELRRSMGKFKFTGLINKFEAKLINGMIAKGYDEEYANCIYKQLEGFGSYGFPESHAASFAHLVYASSWIKCYYPDVFTTALLNSMPMGFYEPAQVVIDARKHDVEVLPVDVNYSYWDNVLEKPSKKYKAIRLGFRQIKGLSEADMVNLVNVRTKPFTDIPSIWQSGISQSVLEKLADADAFRSLRMDRRKAGWEVAALANKPAVLFSKIENEAIIEPSVNLPEMTLSEHVVEDYAALKLSLKGHPVSFLREKLNKKGITPNNRLHLVRNGKTVKVAGLILSRQRPGTAGGVCFMSVEDDGATANVIIFKNLFSAFRKEILQSTLIMVEGEYQHEEGVTHIIAKKLFTLDDFLADLTANRNDELPLLTLSRADEKAPEGWSIRHKPSVIKEKIEMVFPEARNFR